jgi:hypothetical protein
MATKLTKSTLRRIVDTLSALVRQPLSDESNEVPTPAAVRRSKAVAMGPRRKAKKAGTKKAAAKKPAPRGKKAPAGRKKKR